MPWAVTRTMARDAMRLEANRKARNNAAANAYKKKQARAAMDVIKQRVAWLRQVEMAVEEEAKLLSKVLKELKKILGETTRKYNYNEYDWYW